MYKDHFGLTDLPFSIAPDPRYLYMSGQHREALAHLLYGINSDSGFVLLTGEVGTGKTTVCRCLLEQAPPDTDVAFIINPKVSVEELLASLCDELGISYPEGNRSVKVFVDLINSHLLDTHARGRKTVLIIEEAQNLGPDVLEQVRLLTNLETHERKLLQIILLGQPELRDMLARPELRQLAQRITARYHLGPLSEEEVAAYVSHRLSIVGARTALFPAVSFRDIRRLSGGIPRVINMICDRALLGAYSEGKDRVDCSNIDQAAREIAGASDSSVTRKKTLRWIAVAVFIIALGAAFAAAYYSLDMKPLPSSPPSVPAEIKPAEAPKPKLDAILWPDDKPLEQSRAMAFGAVLKRWDINLDKEDGDVCRQLQVRSLRCLSGVADMKNLVGLDRPAVLKMYDSEGREFFAALTGFNGQKASLVIAGEAKTTDTAEIEKWWYGEFTLLWKPPAGFRIGLGPGSSGPEIQWIEKQLSHIQNVDASPGKNTLYNDALVGQIKKFQRSRGLAPDGVIGSQTMIRLSNAAGSKEPRLTAETERK